MKKYFLTGLVVILPFFLTIYIVWIIFKIVAGSFTPLFTEMFQKLVPIHIPNVAVMFISAVVTVLLIWFIGVIASNFIGTRIIKVAEDLLHRVPMARGMYDVFKKLLNIFFMDKSNFKRVVLIEWPTKGIYAIAFITADAMSEARYKTKKELINVFMPTSPTPHTGFLMLIPKEKIITLDTSVDDAIKLIISGGIVVPPSRSKKHKRAGLE